MSMVEVLSEIEYGDSAGVFDEPWPALPPWWDRHQFPDSDGRPVADNDPQLDAIVMLRLGLRDHFADRNDVYVAADLLWYVNRDDSRINVAPDTMVIFGRPPHSRRSYKQWEEGGIGPSVVFEVISHRSTAREMTKKLQFYDEHDVAEYYVYDPEAGTLQGWQRLADGLRLVDIWPVDGHVSPRLGICMSLDGIALALVDETSGRRFPTAAEYAASSRRAEAAEEAAAHARALAEQALARAEEQQARADEQEARAEEQQARADASQAELDALRARLGAEGA